jgi:stalled ribosome rescue protein Dom34
LKHKRQYRRGYPVALLVGLETDHAIIWQVFSKVVKLFLNLKIDGNRTEEKILYNFHESLMDSLRPILNDGVQSVVIAAPPRTTYATEFRNHVQKHHKYLFQSKSPNRVNFTNIVGSAEDKLKVSDLVKTKKFTELISDTTSEEAEQIVDLLEKNLYNENKRSIVLYSLKEIETKIYQTKIRSESRIEYLLLTNKYLNESNQKNRIQRLMQISKNKKVKTKVVNTETTAGNRINQFGGIVFFSIPF